ncbi:MAG: sigma 54-interacting transcriptional regulator [Thermodesulfovibrionales bacterium]|nr:sigma 54-interacting transcriptional regulator [Thermodesulfovibrionales bacterium]
MLNRMEGFFKDTNFLMSVLETMTDGFMVVDKEMNILFFNRAAEEMTGYQRDEVMGKPCAILDTDICVALPNSEMGKKCKLFEKGRAVNKRCNIKAKNGKTVYLLKNAVVLKDDRGEAICAIEVITDISSLLLKELEIEELRNELKNEYGFMGLIGTSRAMQKLYEQIQNTSMSEAPVVICGESGTGKELVAHAIHKLSRRRKGPFIKVNCAALNESLLESELFGHVKGAFTGAIKDREGRFEAAKNGSIFLDEIGDMSPSMQAKLLRVLQEGEIDRVGDHRPVHVNVRLISATNKDLCNLVDSGQLREDFFYRVNVIPIYTPPLRERDEDLPILISHFLKQINLINQRDIQGITPEALGAMKAYRWPGNVRQLISALEYAAITCQNGIIGISNLPESILQTEEKSDSQGKNYKNRDYIISVLSKHNWNKTITAKHLGISRVTLWKMIKELNIEVVK